MRRLTLIFWLLTWLALPGRGGTVSGSQNPAQQAPAAPAPPPAATTGQDPGAAPEEVDSIAARIEDDIITESEVRELRSFQKLVDRQAKGRDEVLRELVDQWIIRSEAATARFSHPPASEVDREFDRLQSQFASADAFHARLAEASLTKKALRRILEQQLYLSRFLDFKFRPAVQVDPKQIEAYYNNELTSELKSRGQSVPPLPDVEDQISEVLTERAINEHAARWLAETRPRLRIDLMPAEARP